MAGEWGTQARVTGESEFIGIIASYKCYMETTREGEWEPKDRGRGTQSVL